MKGTSRDSLSLGRKVHKLRLMYKMVYKLAPPYLCNLCPGFVRDRPRYSTKANNLCLPYVRTERHKKSFLFSTTQLCNSLSPEVRLSSSLGSFKKNISTCFCPSRNYLFYVGDRSTSIFHTRLRLNFSALNTTFLRKIVLFHLHVNIAMLQLKMLNIIICTVQVLLLYLIFCLPPLHTYWEISGLQLQTRKKLIAWLLNGVPDIEFQTNVNLFQSVQSFISQSNRFS